MCKSKKGGGCVMCMILNYTEIGGGTVLDCSEYTGDFINSKTLKIFDSQKNLFTTEDFIVEKSKDCFGSGGAPWVMVKANIPPEFLKKGNTVVFEK
ncbi:MAG: hypothetical protein NC078_06890 [Ruminococcus sp.]|nr:hypothetical protein [Ruminococcus sp.]